MFQSVSKMLLCCFIDEPYSGGIERYHPKLAGHLDAAEQTIASFAKFSNQAGAGKTLTLLGSVSYRS